MANALYDKGRNRFAIAQINWVTDDIRIMLVDLQDYIVNLANHEFLSDVPFAARVAITPLTGKTAVAGVVDANDPTWVEVVGDQSEAVIMYKHVVDANGLVQEASSPLIAYLDTLTGLPVTPSGTDILVRFSDGPSKIFKL